MLTLGDVTTFAERAIHTHGQSLGCMSPRIEDALNPYFIDNLHASFFFGQYAIVRWLGTQSVDRKRGMGLLLNSSGWLLASWHVGLRHTIRAILDLGIGV